MRHKECWSKAVAKLQQQRFTFAPIHRCRSETLQVAITSNVQQTVRAHADGRLAKIGELMPKIGTSPDASVILVRVSFL